MANLKFKFGVDNSLMTKALQENTRQVKQLNELLKKAGKAARVAKEDVEKAQTGFEYTTNSASKHSADDEKGIMGWFKRLSIRIRAMHLHGLDPLTNKFARFFSVMGGAGITAATLFTTAIMGIYWALKKVNEQLQNYYAALSARANTIINISKNRVKEIHNEEKLLDNVIEELKKLNEKLKLSNVEKTISINLVLKIKNKWGLVGVLIDKATGKIKNLNEVQAKINRIQKADQARLLKDQLFQQNTKLDLSLSKYTGKTSIFSRLFAGENPADAFKAFDIFRGRNIEDITALDFFPGWINNYDDKEAVKKINTGKLFFGTTDDQIDFFRLIASHLTNVDAFNQLELIINGLFLRKNLLKALEDLINPDTSTQKINDAQEAFDKARERKDKLNTLLKNIDEDRKKFDLSLEYDQKTTDLKLSIQRLRIKRSQEEIQKYKDEKAAFDKKWEDLLVWDDGGVLTTQGIHDLLKRNLKMQKLYNKYQNINKKYQPRIQAVMDLQAKYNENKFISDTYDKEMRQQFRLKPLTYSYDQAHAAQVWMQENKSKIADMWDFISLSMESDRQSAMKHLFNQQNDLRDARILGQEFTKLDEYNRDLGTLENSKDVLKETVKEMKEATTLTIKLLKQLAEERAAAVKALLDLFEELSKMVAEEVKITNQRKGYLTGLGNDVIAKFMTDNGQGLSLRRQQILREMMQQLGVTSLTSRQKSIAGRIAYIEQLQKGIEEDLNSPFKYGVKSNTLAARGGWNSSVYVSGKDNLPQQQLKTSQKQLEIQKQIHDLLPLLRKEMETLNKNLQI